MTVKGDTPTTPTLPERLAAIAAELPPIGKDRRSPEGYQYRGIEDIMEHVGQLLAKHQVVIRPYLTWWEVAPSPEGSKPGWTDTRATYEWHITCPTGESIVAVTGGIGRDKSDKGLNKAQTQAFKYLLIPLFGIADAQADSEAHDTSEAFVAPPPPSSPEAEAVIARVKTDPLARAAVKAVIPAATLAELRAALHDRALLAAATEAIAASSDQEQPA